MKFRSLLIAISAISILGACTSTQALKETNTKQVSHIDSILEKAANAAMSQGHNKESLALSEKLYKRDIKNPDNAVSFARSLRQNNYFAKASSVLSPFIYLETPNINILSEYAYLQNAMGNYDTAQNTALKALRAQENAPKALHALGVALDAKGNHKEAEKHFRQALENWEGDPIPLLNNLALSLASQGYFDQSISLLQKARMAAPNRIEVQKNLRIISTLQQSTNRVLVPRPIRKADKL